ncbi:MAG: hypothetical protein AAGI01_15055, partial [Myxococcota bacterium]
RVVDVRSPGVVLEDEWIALSDYYKPARDAAYATLATRSPSAASPWAWSRWKWIATPTGCGGRGSVGTCSGSSWPPNSPTRFGPSVCALRSRNHEDRCT